MDPKRPFVGRNPNPMENKRLLAPVPPSSNPFISPSEANGLGASKQPLPRRAPSEKSINSVRRVERRVSAGSLGSTVSARIHTELSTTNEWPRLFGDQVSLSAKVCTSFIRHFILGYVAVS